MAAVFTAMMVFALGAVLVLIGLTTMFVSSAEGIKDYHNDMKQWVMEDTGISLKSDLVAELINGQIVTVDSSSKTLVLSLKETKGGHVELMQTVQTKVESQK